MKIRGILAYSVWVDEWKCNLAGLKLVRLKKEIEVAPNFGDSELILEEEPEISLFNGEEIPFTVPVDRPLRIRIQSPQKSHHRSS